MVVPTDKVVDTEAAGKVKVSESVGSFLVSYGKKKGVKKRTRKNKSKSKRKITNSDEFDFDYNSGVVRKGTSNDFDIISRAPCLRRITSAKVTRVNSDKSFNNVVSERK